MGFLSLPDGSAFAYLKAVKILFFLVLSPNTHGSPDPISSKAVISGVERFSKMFETCIQ